MRRKIECRGRGVGMSLDVGAMSSGYGLSSTLVVGIVVVGIVVVVSLSHIPPYFSQAERSPASSWSFCSTSLCSLTEDGHS